MGLPQGQQAAHQLEAGIAQSWNSSQALQAGTEASPAAVLPLNMGTVGTWCPHEAGQGMCHHHTEGWSMSGPGSAREHISGL